MNPKVEFYHLKNKDELSVLLGKKSQFKSLNYLRKNFSRKKSLYLFAKVDQQFAGFVSCDDNWWERNYFFIREIFVEPKFQKQGIGDVFVDKCIKHARKNRAIGIVTETDFRNTPYQKLLAKKKFKIFENPQWKEGVTLKLTF